jgi:DNA-binding NtrC family response regulator
LYTVNSFCLLKKQNEIMTIRIDLQDLPPSTAEAESATYRLSYHADSKYYSHPINEGETSIGSSSLCDISIQAPGVCGRHACLKRHGNKIFIRNLGKGKVRLHGKEIEDITPLSMGEPFILGSVSAVAECILPLDRQAAVQIEQAQLTSLLGSEDHKVPVLAARQLNRLNELLEQLLRNEKPPAVELLSDVLQNCFSPTSAVLLCRRHHDDWAVLTELGPEGIRLFKDQARTDQCTSFHLSTGEIEYRLLIQFPDEEEQPWRNEFCRLILSLTALCREGRLTGKSEAIDPESQIPNPKSQIDTPWQQMVGNRIRSYLSQQTELCRHSDHVLIIGETGTGKELAARSLHHLWQQPGEFVAINCAAIPAELLDSELFGVTAGAATGVLARVGRFTQARGGTLFLDEISEMPQPLQGKLLRVLQEKEYFPVGGKKLEKADAKVVASSNRSEASLRSDHMRQDLYFRLSQAVVVMPPLRERRQDLAELCEHILNRLERRFGRNVKGLSVAALERLKTYDWPGNVRELQNLLRNLHMSVPPGSLIRSAHLPESFHAKPEIQSGRTLAKTVRDVEREVIKRELDRQNSIKDAAKSLGLSEGYLYRKMKKIGLEWRKRQGD